MLRIRDIDIENNLILAPMEGVTDLVFRRLVRQIGGCGLTYTEFIPAAGLAQNMERCRETAAFDADENPIAIQVYGRDPKWLAEGAKVAQDLGATIVDLNMGCPSKKVCAHSGGSALMKEPELARELVRSIRAAVEIPFTVKMRTGWNPQNKNALQIARMCQEEGAEAVTIHWRTREDLYGGERELDTIAAVKADLSIPVIFNGDIIDVASAREALAYTKCDGLMIGRGAMRNPWVFREIEAWQKGLPAPVVDAAAKEAVLTGYFDALLNKYGGREQAALGRWKKIGKYFTTGLPYGDRLRTVFLRSQTAQEARDRVAEFFEQLRVYESGEANPFEDGVAAK